MQRIDIQPYGCRTFHNVSKTVTGERLKIDKHLRDLSNRLNAVSGSGNGNDNDNNNNKITKDDDSLSISGIRTTQISVLPTC